ncbi:MAG: sugar nucleotide-binding protein [Woeseiaceae bacterium]|nr:sugar nucleotide-binding protein [Woeseiaceae bacterium]
MNKVLLVERRGARESPLNQFCDLFEVVALDSSQVDLTDEMSIRQSIRKTAPNILVNAAAYTAVDQAEAERSKAFPINAEAPRIMSQECLHILVAFFYIIQQIDSMAKSTPPIWRMTHQVL